MKKLKTNYVPGDPVTSAGQNEVNATINEIYEKIDGNALNVPKNSAQYHMVFKDKSNDPTNPCSTLELAGFNGVYFKEITAEEYNALPNKYTDPLPAKVSDPTKIYYDSDVEEEFATIPYTKNDGKGDDKTVPGSIMQKWGNGKKGTVYVEYGVQISSKYYKFALYEKPIRIQLEASHDIDLKTDASLNIKAKKGAVTIDAKEVIFDGPTKFELGELEDGLISQFKITKKQDPATKKYNTKGCDKLIVEIYNNAENKDTGEKLSQTLNIAEQAFLKGTPIKWWYVVANAGKGGDYNADNNPTGEWLEEYQESGLKKGDVALKYGFTVQGSNGEFVGDTTKIGSKIHHYDMGTDTFYNDGTVELGPQEKKAIASCHIFDVIKFITWAKNTQFGPWAPKAQTNDENV